MEILADEDALWLTLEQAAIPHLIAAFDKLLIMEDVQITDVSENYDILSVIGPKAKPVLETFLAEPLNIEGLYKHRRFDELRVLVSRLGYDLWAPRDKADKILRAVSASGATAIDRGTWDVLRTEAGIPIYGVDIDETTTMPEIGENGISYDKGCYVGQEVVAKVKYIGHVNRRFVGLVLSGNDLPEMRNPIRKGGREVGSVTTALFSPAMSKPIALGFVSRVAYSPGTEVEIVSGDKTLNATIVDLPFLR